MGKTFKRRWNKQRLARLKALRKPTDEIMIAGTAASETVKEIIEVLSEPEKVVMTAVEEVPVAETPVPVATTTTATKKPRRRRKKTITTTTTTAE